MARSGLHEETINAVEHSLTINEHDGETVDV